MSWNPKHLCQVFELNALLINAVVLTKLVIPSYQVTYKIVDMVRQTCEVK
jgi:hypothetical protein